MAAGKIYLSAILKDLLDGIDSNLDELKTSMNGVKNSVDSVALSVPAKIDQQIEKLGEVASIVSAGLTDLNVQAGTDYAIQYSNYTYTPPTIAGNASAVSNILKNQMISGVVKVAIDITLTSPVNAPNGHVILKVGSTEYNVGTNFYTKHFETNVTIQKNDIISFGVHNDTSSNRNFGTTLTIDNITFNYDIIDPIETGGIIPL